MKLKRAEFSINCLAGLQNFIVKDIVAKKEKAPEDGFKSFDFFLPLCFAWRALRCPHDWARWVAKIYGLCLKTLALVLA